jgi:capsular polysaccharide transport system permease protein
MQDHRFTVKESDLENASENLALPHGPGAKDRGMGRLKRVNWLFALTVLVPTALASIYYGFVASDVYVSESRFVVHSAQQQPQMSMMGQLLSGSGYSQVDQDTYPVIDYVESRDALKELNGNNFILNHYSRSGDFISRFHVGLDSSFEALWRYYSKHIIAIDVDDTSGITILQVRAYNAEDAKNISVSLIRMAESLINKMNERAATDTVSLAQQEVKEASVRSRETAVALAAYRNSHSIFDPDRQSAMRLQQVTLLQTQLFSAQSQLSQIEAVSPENPQVPVLRKNIDLIQKQIDVTTGVVAGKQDSLSQKMTDFERLQLDSEFADKQLASTMAALENARSGAARKQLYLEELVQPNFPDVAIEPKRIRNIATVFALGLICWGTLSLLIASVREHRD